MVAAVLVAALFTPAQGEPALSAEELARERAALLGVMAQAQAPATDAAERIHLPGGATLGPDAAPIVLVEFGDYQCGFCRRHVLTVMPGLLRDYVEPGRVRYVVIEFPAERNLPGSMTAANAALCAGDQGRYLEMRERIYTHPMSVDAAGMLAHGERIGLDMTAFTRCLETAAHEPAIRGHVALGRQLGVRGTPTFFLARATSDGEPLQFLRRITGAQPLDLFQREIDGLLQGAGGSMGLGAAAPPCPPEQVCAGNPAAAQ